VVPKSKPEIFNSFGKTTRKIVTRSYTHVKPFLFDLLPFSQDPDEYFNQCMVNTRVSVSWPMTHLTWPVRLADPLSSYWMHLTVFRSSTDLSGCCNDNVASLYL